MCDPAVAHGMIAIIVRREARSAIAIVMRACVILRSRLQCDRDPTGAPIMCPTHERIELVTIAKSIDGANTS